MLKTCLVVTAFLLLACCVLYPAVVTAAAQALFPGRANGSLLLEGDRVRGSALIGQTFERPADHPEYFWGRPSAASVDAATGVLVSGGSNEGPLSPALKEEVAQRIAALRATGVTGPVPGDLVTKSASGLDPHISPAAAEIQVPRVARARGLPEAVVRGLVAAHTEAPTAGLLGQARVNVLELNLALDRAGAVTPPARAAGPA